MKEDKFKLHALIALILLILAAYLIRMPGYFWGYHKLNQGRLIVPHIDESGFANKAAAFLNKGEERRKNYILGFLKETDLFLRVFAKGQHDVTEEEVLFAARYMNIIFATLTVILIYYFSLSLVPNKAIAWFSSFVYAFYPLSVIHSHYATPLTSFVFWFWLALFLFYKYTQSQNIFVWYFAWIATACACATKFGFALLIPGLYLLFRDCIIKERSISRLILTLAIAGLIYQYLNYWYPLSFYYKGMLNSTIANNFYGRDHNRWFNPIIYAVVLIPSISIAGVFFACSGLILACKNGFFGLTNQRNRDRLITIELPLLVQLIFTLTLTATFERHLIIFFPYLAILSGIFIFSVFQKSNFSRIRYISTYFLMLYHCLVAINLEYQHYNSRYYLAEDWLRKNLKEGEMVYLPSKKYNAILFENGFLKDHVTFDIKKAQYVLITESMTWRLGRTVLNISNQNSDKSSIYNLNHIEEPILIQEILSNTTKYERVVSFEAETWAPELLIFKKLFHSFNVLTGDVWINRIRVD